MTRKTRLFIVGAMVIVILLIPVILFFLLRPRNVVQTESQQSIPTAQIQPSAPTTNKIQLDPEQNERNDSAGVTTIAKMFTERYGSYSNEANFENLRDVLPLMTDAFATRTNDFIASAKSPDVFYGVSSRVVTVKVEHMDDETGTATILVNTQREEAQGSTQQTAVSYQEIRLELVKEGGIWKVDSAIWL